MSILSKGSFISINLQPAIQLQHKEAGQLVFQFKRQRDQLIFSKGKNKSDSYAIYVKKYINFAAKLIQPQYEKNLSTGFSSFLTRIHLLYQCRRQWSKYGQGSKTGCCQPDDN
jgi:hypothetical protein